MKRMKLRYAGVCRECSVDLPAAVRAVYDPVTKTVLCLSCFEATAPAVTPTTGDEAQHEAATAEAVQTIPADPPEAPATLSSDVHAPVARTPEMPAEAVLHHREGVAGSSARREHERRRAAREKRIRTKHPKMGGLILALSDEPQSTRAWAVGSVGEEKLGRRLDSLAGPLVRVLHDRRIPRSRANIDHIVICPSGVFVIDAKRYRGQRPVRRTEGGLFSPRVEKLFVGKRDRTTLVEGVIRQTDLVRDALADPIAPVKGFLCFVEADWPILGTDFHVRGVYVTAPKRLASVITRPGSLTEPQIDALQLRISQTFTAS